MSTEHHTTDAATGRTAASPSAEHIFDLAADRASFAAQWEAAHDPATVATVGRQMRALATMALGTRAAVGPPGPLVSAGFENTAEEVMRIQQTALREERDIVHLVFDPQTQQKPLGLWVAHRAPNGAVSVNVHVHPHLASSGNHASLVSIFGPDERPQHFRMARHTKSRRLEGWPTEKPQAGMERAGRRWRALTGSHAGDAGDAVHRVGRLGGFGVPHLRLDDPGGPFPHPVGIGGAWHVRASADFDAVEDASARAVCGSDPFIASRMSAYATALTVLLAGRTATRPPEPLLQAGFEPADLLERALLAAAAFRAGHEVLQVSFDPDEPNGPTGVLGLVRDADGAASSVRVLPWCRPGGEDGAAVLASEEGDPGVLVFRGGAALERRVGHPTDDLGPGATRARAIWEELAGVILDRAPFAAPLRRHVRVDGAGMLAGSPHRATTS